MTSGLNKIYQNLHNQRQIKQIFIEQQKRAILENFENGCQIFKKIESSNKFDMYKIVGMPLNRNHESLQSNSMVIEAK